jgi:hypothetical protein
MEGFRLGPDLAEVRAAAALVWVEPFWQRTCFSALMGGSEAT